MVFTFLSYGRADLEDADRVRRDLISNSIRVWRDLEDIRKHEGWDVEIEEILDSRQLTHFLFLETPNSCRKESVCRDEIERAIQNRIPILRLLFGKSDYVPLRIQRKTYIDFRTDYQAAFAQLLTELAKLAKPSASPVPLPISGLGKQPTQQQKIASHDLADHIRLVAPPGTGKSFAIEERVRWLLDRGVAPDEIIVISFTRASSRDLRERITRYCGAHGHNNAAFVRVSTLHSLALTVLMKRRLLTDYPAFPRVLDGWETENIFDVEMGLEIARSPSRCEAIREAVEAYWCTGKWVVPPHMQPEEPVTKEELEAFVRFLDPITQSYSCVLPGEIVKKCTDLIDAGVLQPVEVLETKHLIVDEYQDLNFTDTEFIHSFAGYVPLFVAGDDDQSIYAFRFAYPVGLQDFTKRYKGTTSHVLTECFRCTPEILAVATRLLSQYQDPGRIAKSVVSHYQQTLPGVNGISHRWIFGSDTKEAEAIANSCRQLITCGVEPRDILVLISNRTMQLVALKKGRPPILEEAFQKHGVPVELSRVSPYIDSDSGRFAYALLRVACDGDLVDYVAHRTLLGLLKGVGKTTCAHIRRSVLRNNYSYLDVFYNPLPPGMLDKREQNAIARVQAILTEVGQWNGEDSVSQRKQRVADLVAENFDPTEDQRWLNEINQLPADMSINEVRLYLETNRDDERTNILKEVYERLGLPIPETGFFPPKVRVMTMHGVKGLEAQVVFIPGLESGILPHEKARKYLGLRLEAVRQLYVSITRAKAAIILSYATSRFIQGRRDYDRNPSPFCQALGDKFVDNAGVGLSSSEVNEIVDIVTALKAQDAMNS